MAVSDSSIDLPLPSAAAVEQALRDVHKVIDACVPIKDLGSVIEYGRSLIVSGQSKAMALLFLLWELKKHWSAFGVNDSLENVVYSEWGLSRKTIQNCLGVWRDVFANPAIPEDCKIRLLERPMRTLKRLRRPAREELFDEQDWHEVSVAPSHYEVLKIVDEKIESRRGREPLVITIDSSGQIYAWFKGEVRHCGFLRVSEADLEDDIRYKAVTKIINATGMQEK